MFKKAERYKAISKLYIKQKDIMLPQPCKKKKKGSWVAQFVKRLTHDFGSGHDLMGCKIEPCAGLHAH